MHTNATPRSSIVQFIRLHVAGYERGEGNDTLSFSSPLVRYYERCVDVITRTGSRGGRKGTIVLRKGQVDSSVCCAVRRAELSPV